MKNPKKPNQADALYRELFFPKPCPCCEPKEIDSEVMKDIKAFLSKKETVK